MSTIVASNLQASGGAGTAATLASINGGPLAGFRNRIINGNFDIWQRGTSFTGNEYGADRWAHSRIGTTHTVTRQAFTLGQTAVPGEPEYFCRTVVSSVAGADNYAILAQRIEDVRTFAGQQVTISFWAKADATKNIAIELVHYYGTGGTPSAPVTGIGATKVSIGTSWQKITITATVPSIGGKTLGTNSDHHIALHIWFDAGSNFNARTSSLGQQSGTFDIAQVQIEPGPVATPFERRSFGQELVLCQRYYEKSYAQSVYPGTVTSNGCWFGVAVNGVEFYSLGGALFRIIKRTSPTVTAYSPISGTAGVLGNFTLTSDQGNAGINNVVDSSFRFSCNNSAMTAIHSFGVHWTASAEL